MAAGQGLTGTGSDAGGTGGADWPPSFLAELEAPVPADEVWLWGLGGPSFLLRTADAAVWIDPYFGRTPENAPDGILRTLAVPVDPARVRLATAILVTHEHDDHCHRDSLLPMLAGTGARCLTPASGLARMRTWGSPPDRVEVVVPGARIDLGPVRIDVAGACDPHEPGAVTYVVTAGGVRLFVGGDTHDGAILSEVGAAGPVDYALLAYGADWYLSADALARAARRLRARTVVACHWELWHRKGGDVVELALDHAAAGHDHRLRILPMGRRLGLEPATPVSGRS